MSKPEKKRDQNGPVHYVIIEIKWFFMCTKAHSSFRRIDYEKDQRKDARPADDFRDDGLAGVGQSVAGVLLVTALSAFAVMIEKKRSAE